VIISDNGPQFIGLPYKQMVKEYGISHVTSSPHHPKSHGFIERMIRTMKGFMRKSPREFYESLLIYRTTPLGPDMPSPSELLFGRQIQSNMPIRTSGPKNDKFRVNVQNQQHRSEERYNAHSRSLPELNLDQPVYYQDVARKTWLPAKVTGIGPEPRSYTLECDGTGRSLRRNRVLIRPRNQSQDNSDATSGTI
jgi:transposase InsO family protein